MSGPVEFNQMFYCHPLVHIRVVFYLHLYLSNNHQSKHAGRNIIKFADDSVVFSLLNNKNPDHGSVVAEFLKLFSDYQFCKNNRACQ